MAWMMGVDNHYASNRASRAGRPCSDCRYASGGRDNVCCAWRLGVAGAWRSGPRLMIEPPGRERSWVDGPEGSVWVYHECLNEGLR
jgi:hypothetical protein